MPSSMMALQEPQGILDLVRIDNSVLNPPSGTSPDHALGVLVGSTALAEHHGPAEVVQQHVQSGLRLVRVEHGRKLLEVAKEDILPGGTATQRHVGGQQAMELVAMEEPPAGDA